MQKKSLTLAGASTKITRFLQSSRDLDQAKRSYLLGVYERIKEIHAGNRDFNLSEINNLRQALVMKKENKQYQAAIMGLMVSLVSLVNHVAQEKNEQEHCEDKAYINLVSDIHASVQGVIGALKIITTTDDNNGNSRLGLVRQHQHTSSLCALFFSGRYYPFDQGIDPFFGMEMDDAVLKEAGGYCYGYVKAWASDIELHGLMTKTPRLDEQVLYEQQHQNSGIFRTIKSLMPGMFSPWSADIGVETNFPFLFNKILACLDPNRTYGLSFGFNEGPGHIIGIRFIPGTNEYEIFDPGHGIVVFNNRNKARDWLVYHFFSTYKNNYIKDNAVKGTLTLEPLTIQPAHAKSSLPMWEVKDYQSAVDDCLENAKWTNIHELHDANFWERHKTELGGLALFYAVEVFAALAVSTCAVSVVALSGVTSLGILACVFAGPLAPALALSLGIVVYAAYSMIDQYRYTSSVGFFSKHGSNQAPSQDKTSSFTPSLSSAVMN